MSNIPDEMIDNNLFENGTSDIKIKDCIGETMCIEKLNNLYKNMVSSNASDMTMEEYNHQLAHFYFYTANKMGIYGKVINKCKILSKDLTGEPSNELKEAFCEYNKIDKELTWLGDSIGVLEKIKINLYTERITSTK